MTQKIKVKKFYPEEARLVFTKYELKKPNSKILFILWGIATYSGALLVTIPFIWMLITSMIPSTSLFLTPDKILKSFKFNFEYFEKAWAIAPFIRYFLNSLFITLSVVIGQIFVSAAAAYSISKLKPTGYQIFLFLFPG